jgi:hypothetical protein
MEEKDLEEKMLEAENVPEAQLEIEGKSEDVEYMTPAPVLSAGQVYIYDTKTHERSVCRRNNLRHKLSLKREDGSLIFTTVKPKTPPKRGTLKCMLHPDERKPEYEAWGFPFCKKSNLTSPFQVRRHMQKRHKQEWETIQEEERRIERDKERQLRESLITMGKREETPLYQKEPKKK